MCTLASSLLCEIVVVAAAAAVAHSNVRRATLCGEQVNLCGFQKMLIASCWPRGGEGGTRAELSSRRSRARARAESPSPPTPSQTCLRSSSHGTDSSPDGINELSRRSLSTERGEDGGGINSGSLNKTTASRARSVISRLLDGLAH